MNSSLPFASGAVTVTMPDGYVVDTDVISYLFRGDTRAEPYRRFLTGSLLAVSFMTIAELDRWALHRNWGRSRQVRMSEFLTQFTIVLVDRALCQAWAHASDEARRNGRPIQVADAWIAATAISLGVLLITHNRADYAGVDSLHIVPDDSRD